MDIKQNVLIIENYHTTYYFILLYTVILLPKPFLYYFKSAVIPNCTSGGYLPYQIGRLDLGFQVRFGKNLNSHPPSEFMKQFCYDTIMFDGQALKFLRDLVGAKQLLTGTDLPFNVADVDFRQRINALEIPQSEKELIFYQNAQELFHIAH